MLVMLYCNYFRIKGLSNFIEPKKITTWVICVTVFIEYIWLLEVVIPLHHIQIWKHCVCKALIEKRKKPLFRAYFVVVSFSAMLFSLYRVLTKIRNRLPDSKNLIKLLTNA